MSMNKKIIGLLIIISFCFSILNVNAANCPQGYTENSDGSCVVNCEEMNENTCQAGEGCYWNKVKKTCEYGYIAENPCSESEILRVLQFIGYLLYVAKIFVPLLIIGFATFDLFKSVIDKDEKSISKQLKIVGIRLISGLLVFFLPSIIYAVFGISTRFNTYEESKYQMCADCLLKPTSSNCNYE